MVEEIDEIIEATPRVLPMGLLHRSYYGDIS